MGKVKNQPEAAPEPGRCPARLELVLPGNKQETLRLLSECQLRQAELERQIEGLRRSQEELEKSREKYTLLYDFAPVGYFTLDRSGSIQTVNLTGAKLLGIERSRLVNRRFAQLVAAEDRPSFTDFLHQVFVSQDKETCRLQLTRSDNQPLFVRIEATATESGDECLAAIVNITERRLAEQALRESEYNLAKAQEMAHVGGWSLDTATGAVSGSDELLRILGLSRQDASREAFARVVHPDDLETVMDHLRQGTENGTHYEIEHRLLFKDGTIKWVHTICEPAVNNAGHVVRLYGTTQDITERKNAEVQLRSKTNELQAIFDSMSDGVSVYDHKGLVQHHNLISPRLFPQETLTGHSCRDIFHPETLTSPQHCPVERALRGERVETFMVSARGGQEARYLDISTTPIEGAQGEESRALVIFRDVTEKRLQELHLLQTEKMSSIGVLAAGVAHEINNPLTSVAGYAEALLRRFRDEPSMREDPRLEVFPKYLEVIVRESYHCKGIIDSLLNFSRKSDGFVGEVDLNGILREILELLRPQMSSGQIEIKTRLQQELPPVHGDPSGLRQVFMNLMLNAHQAIRGAGLVEITTESSDQGRMVSVQIRDTGCGIAPHMIDQIWNPFFTTKEVGKGLGLGLALSYNIVKRHGGTISVESRVDEGSLFTVKLPAS